MCIYIPPPRVFRAKSAKQILNQVCSQHWRFSFHIPPGLWQTDILFNSFATEISSSVTPILCSKSFLKEHSKYIQRQSSRTLISNALTAGTMGGGDPVFSWYALVPLDGWADIVQMTGPLSSALPQGAFSLWRPSTNWHIHWDFF